MYVYAHLRYLEEWPWFRWFCTSCQSRSHWGPEAWNGLGSSFVPGTGSSRGTKPFQSYNKDDRNFLNIYRVESTPASPPTAAFLGGGVGVTLINVHPIRVARTMFGPCKDNKASYCLWMSWQLLRPFGIELSASHDCQLDNSSPDGHL
jgi:hypothetical protein